MASIRRARSASTYVAIALTNRQSSERRNERLLAVQMRAQSTDFQRGQIELRSSRSGVIGTMAVALPGNTVALGAIATDVYFAHRNANRRER